MSTYADDQLQAIQNVVDRVAANQDGAPRATVIDELRSGAEAAGVSIESEHLDRLAAAIDAADGNISARAVLT